MIQRIQTVYLFAVAILMIATLFAPLTILQVGENLFSFDASGISTMLTENPELIYPTWGMFALTAIIALVALITIFLFKNRILQIRLSVFNSILMLGFYGLYAYYIWRASAQLGDASITGKIALAFPLVSLILNYLAIRNIGADEALVRSLNRLR